MRNLMAQEMLHQTISSIKLPILEKGEYDIWAMKMEHYLSHTDYLIWKVIQNGNGHVFVTTDTNGMIKVLPPKTAEEVVAREKGEKSKDHFTNGLTRRPFNGLHKGYDRFQTLLSQLEIHGAGVLHEDANQKFLRDVGYNGNKARDNGRRPAYHDDSKALVTIDGEDINWSGHVEEDVQNFAMMAYSSSNSGSDNEVKSCSKTCEESYARLKKLYIEQRDKLGDVSVEITAYTLALKKVEAQLLCHQQNQLAYEQKIRFMKIDLDDKTDVLTYNKKLLAEALKEKEDLKSKFKIWQNSSKNLSRLLNTQISDNDKFGLGYGDYRYGTILSYENEVLQSVFMNKESDLEDTPVNDRYVKGMHAVPLPMKENYMPSGPDAEIDYSKFTYGLKQTSVDESESKPSKYASCESDSNVETITSMSAPVDNAPKVVCEPKVWTNAPIIEEYKLDSDDDLGKVQETGTPNHCPKVEKRDRNTHSIKGLDYAFTKKTCFVYGSFSYLIRECNFHEKRMAKQAALTKSKDKDDPHKALKDKGIVDSGCSRYMTGNKAYLTDYYEFKGGSVAFGGSNGKIIGKGKIKVGRLDFKDVYYVEELKHYNLFSVSQMCDKKNKAENQFNHKVKTIRSDNRTELKNHDLIEFCGLKWNKREYSNARTLQQNGVAERKYRTLIKAARTMVLVTKAQKKTPYELLTGRQPIISYLRPFGCHVTILNTIDQLGKFDGKSDLGFLVGYSLNSKDFRVYNLKAKRVEENLHVNFLENKPNVAGKGHAWMFDLDYLTNSMNYEPVSLENQANKFAGPKEAHNSAGTEANDDQEQIFQEELEKLKRREKEANDVARKEPTHENQDANTNSTNLLNAISSPISTAGPSSALNDGEPSYPDDPSMPHLEDIYASPSERIFTDSSYDDEGVVTDFNNLEPIVTVSPTPTTRIHTIHPKTQILSDPMSVVQTRSKVNKNLKLMLLKKAIGTKWVYRNKKDERGVVVRNKVRLVAQGHRQKEGIDYDEVFAPVARIEAIRIFLAFASYIGFIVYQMDVKSAFLYGTIDEEVYVTQPPSFVNPKFPNKVYKVVKALYGLHQAPRAWYATFSTFLEKKKSWCDEFKELMKNRFQMSFMGELTFFLGLQVKQKEDGIFISQDKYVAEILKKFYFLSVKTASTLIETQKPLVKDKEVANVDILGNPQQKVDNFLAGDLFHGNAKSRLLWLLLLQSKELASPKQTTLGKDPSNLLIVDSLLKTIWLSMHHVIAMKHWLFQSKRLLMIVTEDVIQQVLYFYDADGMQCLPNEDIFTELSRMGYEKPPPKLTFYKAFFSAQWKFLIHTLVQCISAKRMAWNEFSCLMAFAVICLTTGRKFNFSKYIFDSMYTSPALTQKGFSGVETPLFATMIVQPPPFVVKEEADVKVHAAPTSPSPTTAPSSPPQEPIPRPPQAQPAAPSSPPQAKPQPDTFDSSISILNALMDTCATLSQKVSHLEQDKIAQALEIIKLKKRVKKLEKQQRSKSLGLKRLRKIRTSQRVESSAETIKSAQEDASKQRGRIKAIDDDEDITLVDAKTQVDLGAELQGRKDEYTIAIKDASAVEPTVFDDEDMTMTMAQTIIKMKSEKERLLDEQIAKRLHDDEVKQAAAREKQEKGDLEKAKMQEKHLDNIMKYQSLKRKPISIAQARKNMIVYLKNMAGYKMEYFKGMTYDKVRPIFERDYNKVQSLFKHGKDVDEEPTKKRVAEETLLQECFKKLKAVEISGSHSTQDTLTNDHKEMSKEDVKNMLEIVPVSEFKVEALQVKYPLID
nr:hypothetical protein [Tanacetum cinerariifolium]